MKLTCVCVKDNLYWSDWEARSILQVDKLRAAQDGYGVKNAVLHLYSPMDVRVYHELRQPPADSESRICLIEIISIFSEETNEVMFLSQSILSGGLLPKR